MIEYVIFLVVIAAFICMLRIAKGPTAPDRVLAADTINSMVIAIIVLLALFYNNNMFADIAIVYATLSFLSTLAIAKYLMKAKEEVKGVK
jgi:multicomponent Na+:H+ antiporter subunit F